MSAVQLQQIIIDNSIPVAGVGYPGNGNPNRVDYLPEATPEQIVIGDTIATQFEAAAVDIDGDIVTATCNVSDTDIVFLAYGSDGTLQERITITAVGGVAEHTLDLTPDLYTIIAYGTMSYMSNFAEVTVI